MNTQDLFNQAFYNTTHESGETLVKSHEKAFKQSEVILGIYHRSGTKTLTPSQVYALYLKFTRLESTPITSIRRAMSNLMKSGELIKTEHMGMGMYGKKEHYYRLK